MEICQECIVKSQTSCSCSQANNSSQTSSFLPIFEGSDDLKEKNRMDFEDVDNAIERIKSWGVYIRENNEKEEKIKKIEEDISMKDKEKKINEEKNRLGREMDWTLRAIGDAFEFWDPKASSFLI